MADTTLTAAQSGDHDDPGYGLAFVAGAGPRGGDFIIKIDNEYEYVEWHGDQATRPWQVRRGFLGSAPADHALSAAVAVEPAIGGGGSGLPSPWNDGGHGDVTATVDDATKTPITVNTLVGQTVPGIAVIGVAGAAAAAGLYVQSGDSPGGSIATFLDNSESYGLTLEATGEIQQSVASVGAAWTARSYPGDRIAPPLHDILQLSSFGSLTLWADTDIDALSLNFVDNGFTGGRYIVCGNVFRVLASGALVTAANAAPADGDLVAGDLALWFDDTNGASSLRVKGKSADGTVVTATVPLA